MNKNLHRFGSTAFLTAAVFLHMAGLNRATAEATKLYEISTKDLCAQIFDDVMEREKALISPGSNGKPTKSGSEAEARKQDKSLRVVLLFDVSRSVANKAAASGMPMDRIKKEVIKLVDSLPPKTQFNVVQFTRNYMPYRTELVPADATNRKSFRNWVDEKWNDSGKMSAVLDGATKNPSGIIGVLEFSKTMKPDAIYLISDGSFEQGKAGKIDTVNWSDIKRATDFASGSGKKVPINFIAFAPEQADARQMKTIADQSGGRFSVLGKQAP